MIILLLLSINIRVHTTINMILINKTINNILFIDMLALIGDY